MAVTASAPSYPYVRGAFQTTKMLAPASTAINPGDMLWDNGSGTVAIASAFTWSTNVTDSQINFAPLFVGISLDKRLASDASTGQLILIMTEGTCYYPCAALGATAAVGTFVAPAKDTGNNLLDQQVATCVATIGIGKLVEYAASAATQVLIHVRGVEPLGQVT